MSTKVIDNFVWIIQLDMVKEKLAHTHIGDPDRLYLFNNVFLKEVLKILKNFNDNYQKYDIKDAELDFNIFIFGDVNLLGIENQEVVHEILEIEKVLTKDITNTINKDIKIKIHLMSKLPLITLEDIYSHYFNLGKVNVIVLEGHGLSIERPLVDLSPAAKKLFLETSSIMFNEKRIDISDLSQFSIHTNSGIVKINAYTILDKIKKEKEYIIIPLMCFGSDFIKDPIPRNVTFMLPNTCGTIGQSLNNSEIILRLLYANGETLQKINENKLTFNFKILNNNENTYIGVYPHTFSISRQSSTAAFFNSDYDSEKKYLKYKQKYLQLKYFLYNYK